MYFISPLRLLQLFYWGPVGCLHDCSAEGDIHGCCGTQEAPPARGQLTQRNSEAPSAGGAHTAHTDAITAPQVRHSLIFRVSCCSWWNFTEFRESVICLVSDCVNGLDGLDLNIYERCRCHRESSELEKPKKTLPMFGAMKGGSKFKLKTGTIGVGALSSCVCCPYLWKRSSVSQHYWWIFFLS